MKRPWRKAGLTATSGPLVWRIAEKCLITRAVLRSSEIEPAKNAAVLTNLSAEAYFRADSVG